MSKAFFHMRKLKFQNVKDLFCITLLIAGGIGLKPRTSNGRQSRGNKFHTLRHAILLTFKSNLSGESSNLILHCPIPIPSAACLKSL